jgi:D-alanyl-D-alanine endopeptidase (penicillin-binding protein 7)
VASTGNWVVVSVLTLVAAMTFLAPEAAQAAGRTVKKRAHVTVKPLVSLGNRPQATVVTVRRGNLHRVSSVMEIQPARPSFGQLYGLHSTTDSLDLKSGVALVLDQDTNEVLFSKNSQTVLPIASLTKLMTALVVTETHQPLDELLTVTDDDIDTEKGSRSRLRVGTVLRREEMLHLALMSSENRAANALGRHFPGGLNAFVAAMNRKAIELGMNDTHYVEPTGLSSRNQSSARDLATLVKAAHEHQIIRELSTSPEFQVEIGNRTQQFRNTNNLVRSPSWEIGLQKTGYITEAGRCLVMQAKMAGRKLIMVFLDSAGKYSRIGDAERVRRWVNETTHQGNSGIVPAAVPAELPTTGDVPKLTS